MADLDIHKSKHLLKRLEEEMMFLKSLISQAQIVVTNLKETWNSIDRAPYLLISIGRRQLTKREIIAVQDNKLFLLLLAA